MIKKLLYWRDKKDLNRRFDRCRSKLVVGEGCLINYKSLHPSLNSQIQIGNQSIIHASLACQKEGAQLTIGSNVYLGRRTQIVSTTDVIIGDYVLISFGCYITDTDGHPVNYKERMDDVINRLNGWKDWSKVKCSPVKIGSHCWIGPNVVVLKGVKIGRGAIIGAGSVVTKDIPEFSLAAGSPAKVIKKLDQQYEKE